MASRFTRNIRDTRLDSTQWKQDEMEPLNTNEQNDLLSDGEDVYVRNKDKYEPLTKGIINLESEDEHIISVERLDKNTAILKPSPNIVTEVVSDNNALLQVDQQGHKITLKPKGGSGDSTITIKAGEGEYTGYAIINDGVNDYPVLGKELFQTLYNQTVNTIGALSDLTTNDKTSIVNAINEINTHQKRVIIASDKTVTFKDADNFKTMFSDSEIAMSAQLMNYNGNSISLIENLSDFRLQLVALNDVEFTIGNKNTVFEIDGIDLAGQTIGNLDLYDQNGRWLTKISMSVTDGKLVASYLVEVDFSIEKEKIYYIN